MLPSLIQSFVLLLCISLLFIGYTKMESIRRYSDLTCVYFSFYFGAIIGNMQQQMDLKLCEIINLLLNLYDSRSIFDECYNKVFHVQAIAFKFTATWTTTIVSIIQKQSNYLNESKLKKPYATCYVPTRALLLRFAYLISTCRIFVIIPGVFLSNAIIKCSMLKKLNPSSKQLEQQQSHQSSKTDPII